MSKQIAVRLADELVGFIDAEVAEGRATSRANLVSVAVRREQRRSIAARDAGILISRIAAGEVDPDGLDDLSAYAARTPMDDID